MSNSGTLVMQQPMMAFARLAYMLEDRVTGDGDGPKTMREPGGENVARQIQAGHPELFGELVRLHSGSLLLIIRRLIGNRAAADDLLQETWEAVVKKFGTYDCDRPLKPWLTKIAINRCRDHLRRERLRRFWRSVSKRQESAGEQECAGVREPRNSLENLEIADAVSALSPKLREVVVLKFYSDLTHDEIAKVLGIPAGTVKSRLFYALTQLKASLGNEERCR